MIYTNCSHPKYLLVVLFSLTLLASCASVEVREITIVETISSFNTAYISKIEVNSKETNGDAIDTNNLLKNYAENKLKKLISMNYEENTSSQSKGRLALKIKIDIVYGNRALRWLSPGKGQGSVNSVLEVRDSTADHVLYHSSAESILTMGAAGGSMKAVVEKNIDKLLKSYEKVI